MSKKTPLEVINIKTTMITCNDGYKCWGKTKNQRKTKKNAASHGSAMTEQRSELFVTEPFHMQILWP